MYALLRDRPLTLASLLALAYSLGPWSVVPRAAADEYVDRVAPFVKDYCVSCHNDKKAQAGLNFDRYQESSDVVREFRRWENVIEFVRNGEMPPEDAREPTIAERERVVSVLESMLLTEAKKHAGDPGAILPRRLSNTEYDLSVRDLTGIDIRPTADFPADPAAGEGFDNTGEALTMSPGLLKKYLAAAQHVANHLVLKTDGVEFAPYPVLSYNERKKLTEQAILDFYRRHEVDLGEYLEAAWRFQHRDEKQRGAKIRAWAKRAGLSERYLALLWETLQAAPNSRGHLRLVGLQWMALPKPASATERPPQIDQLVDDIKRAKAQFYDLNAQLIRPNAGTWPIGQLDLRAKHAAARNRFNPDRIRQQVTLRFDRVRRPAKDQGKEQPITLRLRVEAPFAEPNGLVVAQNAVFSKQGNLPQAGAKPGDSLPLREILSEHAPALFKQLQFGTHPRDNEIGPNAFVLAAPSELELTIPASALPAITGMHLYLTCKLESAGDVESAVTLQHSIDKPLATSRKSTQWLVSSPNSPEWVESNEQFCRAFPNRFVYVHPDRGLAAGFHLVEGFFRDDQPLVDDVLSDAQRSELNALWRELHFVTQSDETLLRGFVWFERSERHVLHDKRFDFLRPEDPQLVDDKLLGRFERLYHERLGVKLKEDALAPQKPDDKFDMIHGFFENIRRGLKRRQQQLRQAERLALRDVEELARRAYARPLRERDRQSLRRLYTTLREQGQDVEAALRGVMVAILMSPDFQFRIIETPMGPGRGPLTDIDLASRLSYFLWSSLPDDPLLAAAEKGGLSDEEELRAQTRRMLQDARIASFAREFLGQWLRFRDYLVKDPINGTAFREYDEPLRAAMFEEPVRLATDLIQRDQPITKLLNSNSTFVNERLAKHYGGDIQRAFQQQRARLGAASNRDAGDLWLPVDGLREAGRGGLFGMGVVLTKNSAGQRTSPVKRGFWTVHHLLGKHFPPPPAEVPELPPGEKEATKTIRELIADHTRSAKCALCHTHFDSFGLAMEGFDPIGRARTKDLAGHPIDNVATLPDGRTAAGIPGLIEYIEDHRRDEFVRTFCRKFLGYALGRSVILSDQPLLQKMEQELARNDYRFSAVFDVVVSSSQFRQSRGRQFVSSK